MAMPGSATLQVHVDDNDIGNTTGTSGPVVQNEHFAKSSKVHSTRSFTQDIIIQGCYEEE
jgi:hypothetical protein